MASLQSVTLIGRLGVEPESSFTQDGTAQTKLRLACDNFGKDKTTSWYNVRLTGRRAEVAQEFCKKGSQVCVVGDQRISEWTDRQGAKRTTVEVYATSLQLLGPKASDAAEGGERAEWDDDVPL